MCQCSPLLSLACMVRSRYLVLSVGLMTLKREVGALLWSLKDESRKASSLPLFFKLPWSKSGRQSGDTSRS